MVFHQLLSIPHQINDRVLLVNVIQKQTIASMRIASIGSSYGVVGATEDKVVLNIALNPVRGLKQQLRVIDRNSTCKQNPLTVSNPCIHSCGVLQ